MKMAENVQSIQWNAFHDKEFAIADIWLRYKLTLNRLVKTINGLVWPYRNQC